VNVETEMSMSTIYDEVQRGPKGPPGTPACLIHPWTGEEVYDFDIDKYLELFEKGEKGMSYEFQGFAAQGWQCPICKRVYSPTTSMCLYCGGEQKTIVSTGTSTDKLIPGEEHEIIRSGDNGKVYPVARP